MSDSKLVRGFQARLLELPEGLLVAVLYAAACWAARQCLHDAHRSGYRNIWGANSVPKEQGADVFGGRG